MFEIKLGDRGQVMLSGRLDAAQSPRAQEFLDGVEGARIVDLAELEYISSAGLGILLRTQKRLMQAGAGLTLINANHHISDVFRYSGLDRIFNMRPTAT